MNTGQASGYVRSAEQIAAMKGKYENLMLAFDVFVFGLVAGKMSMQ
jgi:hypothetical protein